MKALLLAGGQGTRLRPLTDDRPKPMVEIGGEPAIAHALRWLRRQGVNEVAINLHAHPEVLRRFVGDGSQFDLQVIYSFESEISEPPAPCGRCTSSFVRRESWCCTATCSPISICALCRVARGFSRRGHHRREPGGRPDPSGDRGL